MSDYSVVIVGGSAAGLAAAITSRRQYPDKKVLVIRKEAKVLVPCGIPYIFGTVGSTDKNLIPDAVLEKNGVDLLIDDVMSIDREASAVKTAGGKNIPYDRLVLATGSSASRPPIPGADAEGVYFIEKNVDYLDKLQAQLANVKNLVLIGGGYIGVEVGDECKKSGVEKVTIVEMLSHCLMLAYDEDVASGVDSYLAERGLNLRTDTKVSAIKTENGKAIGVELDGGEVIDAEMVILSVGAFAEVSLAKEAGLELGPMKSVEVDRFMRTSDPKIFACGDCAEKRSFFGGRPCNIKLASIACSEGRIAAANLFGTRRENFGSIGVYGTAIGERAYLAAGLTETCARDQGYEVVVGVAEAPDRHPGGMPGMHPLKLKLVFEKRSGVILGGQIVGGLSSAEMVNTLSMCIQNRMTAEDIATFQPGTHPAMTASPVVHQIFNAAEMAIKNAQT